MRHITSFADDRSNGMCVYCGGKPETREHVPPKIFLDRPYPQELPVVESCRECNQGFSKDEQYMACLIDCVISGTSDPISIQREAIQKTLRHTKSLSERLNQAKRDIDNRTVFEVEHDRVWRVVTKIAIGHVLYELNLVVPEEDAAVTVVPLENMTNEAVLDFESLGSGEFAIWPEVSSRAMRRLVEPDEDLKNGWILVQPDRYRYAVIQHDVVEVRMVFSEYLACQVVWEDSA